mgnify:CR=1 FL=1
MSILSDRELHERYDEFLDEIYPKCEIAGLSYYTAHVLKNVDPVAYRCGFNDWLDSECRDGRLFETASGDYSDDEAETV